MSELLNVKIDDGMSPAVTRVFDSLTGAGRIQLAGYVGRSVQHAVGVHVLAYAGSHHATAQQLGASPTNFLADAYEQVTGEDAVEPEVNRVALNLPSNAFARAFHDVDIFPTGGKTFLTFAATAQAYGKRAGEFNNLTFAIVLDPQSGNFRPALVEAASTSIKIGRAKKDGTRTVKPVSSSTGRAPVFWLVRSSHQAQERDRLPSDAELTTAAKAGAVEFIDAKILKGGAV